MQQRGRRRQAQAGVQRQRQLRRHEQAVGRVAAVGQDAEGAGQQRRQQQRPVLQATEQPIREGLRNAGPGQHLGHHREQEHRQHRVLAGVPGVARIAGQQAGLAAQQRHQQRAADQPAAGVQERRPGGQVGIGRDPGQPGQGRVQARRQARHHQAGDQHDVGQGAARRRAQLGAAGPAVEHETQHDQRAIGRQQGGFGPQQRRGRRQQRQAGQHPAGLAGALVGGGRQSGAVRGAPEQCHPDDHQQGHRHHADQRQLGCRHARIGRGQQRAAAHGAPGDQGLAQQREHHQLARLEAERPDQQHRAQHADAEAGGRLRERADQETGEEQQAAPRQRVGRRQRVTLAGIAARGHLPEQQAAQDVGGDDGADPQSARQGMAQLARAEDAGRAEQGHRRGREQAQHGGQGGVQAAAGDGGDDDQRRQRPQQVGQHAAAKPRRIDWACGVGARAARSAATSWPSAASRPWRRARQASIRPAVNSGWNCTDSARGP
ncbi:Uncharacterised protein [Achromobacter sp. 2789STDY5608621]|nr:Uncharacterised protein [Achromobacter sp. 2789STDY5608621]